MSIKQNPENAYCYGCQMTVDIFKAAHILENKPLKGKDWIEKNLLYLADKYGVEKKMQDLTPDEIYEYRTYDAYRLASRLVAKPDLGDYSAADAEIKVRGWDKEKLEKWGIGTVNFAQFREILKHTGYEPNFLRGVDLDRAALFNESNLIFTVHDENFRPVGFSARNLNYKDGDPASGPKFNSSKTTGLECNIFKKGERLYGLELAKDAGGPLYIFEGQLDVVTARHYGIMNCCCTLGTAFTDHHINLLKKHGLFNIILVFDGDAPGRRAAQKTLDEKFSKHKEFRVQLVQLPAGEDPDNILREQGLETFLSLKKWSAFQWMLTRLLEEFDEDNEEQRLNIAERMAPIIASEVSLIRQEEMCRDVAKITGYDTSTILSEVRRLRNERDSKVLARKKGVVEALVDKVKWNPEEIETVLDECRFAIDTINRETNKGDQANITLDFVLSQKERDESKTGDFEGFNLEPDGLGSIGNRLNGDWRGGCLFFIGGTEQAGKSSLSAQMGYEIVRNEKNDAIVIYHSIDDAARFILYKWICRAAGGDPLELNHISSPKFWEKQIGKDIVSLREKGYNEIINLVKDGKLILKDAIHGITLPYFESVLRNMREKTPDKRIVMIIDSFHKIHEMGGSFDKGHEKIRKTSNKLKEMTTRYDAVILSTVEYRKLQPAEDPDNAAISGSNALAYDANVILHLYNDLHTNGEEKAILVHQKDNKIMPRIRAKFGKNKVAGYEDREFLDFYAASATMRPVDKQTAIEEQKIRQTKLLEQKNSR
jgi:DNA primase catalytic core